MVAPDKLTLVPGKEIAIRGRLFQVEEDCVLLRLEKDDIERCPWYIATYTGWQSLGTEYNEALEAQRLALLTQQLAALEESKK